MVFPINLYPERTNVKEETLSCDCPDIANIHAHYEREANQLANARGIGDVDWTELFTRFITTVTVVASGLNGTPEEKKALVVAAAVKFYASVLKPILSSAIGRPVIFDMIVGPVLERLLPLAVSGLYNAVVKLIDRLMPKTEGTRAFSTFQPL